jgi:hypothetical protein
MATIGIFAQLEAAMADIAAKAAARDAAKATYNMAQAEHDRALAAAQKLYGELQGALSPIIQPPANFHP